MRSRPPTRLWGRRQPGLSRPHIETPGRLSRGAASPFSSFLRDSTFLSTARMSGAVISLIGRAPIAGSARLKQPFRLGDGVCGFPLPPLLVNEFGPDGLKGIRRGTGLCRLRLPFRTGGVDSLRQQALGVLAGSACVFEADGRIDSDGQDFLATCVAIGKTPALCSIASHPKLKPTAIRQFGDPTLGLSRADRKFGKRHVGICPVGRCPIPTDIPTFWSDFNRRVRTLVDGEGPGSTVLSVVIWTVTNDFGRRFGAG